MSSGRERKEEEQRWLDSEVWTAKFPDLPELEMSAAGDGGVEAENAPAPPREEEGDGAAGPETGKGAGGGDPSLNPCHRPGPRDRHHSRKPSSTEGRRSAPAPLDGARQRSVESLSSQERTTGTEIGDQRDWRALGVDGPPHGGRVRVGPGRGGEPDPCEVPRRRRLQESDFSGGMST